MRLAMSCKVTLQNFTNLPPCHAKLSIFTDLFFKIFLVQIFDLNLYCALWLSSHYEAGKETLFLVDRKANEAELPVRTFLL